jgi:aspartate ammonia-lyase
VAAGISDRLRMAAERVTGAGPAQLIGDLRTEHDSLGERELPDEVYYGVQTLRAMENFAISGVFVKNFEHMIEALAFVKKAAAQANCELGVLDETNEGHQQRLRRTAGRPSCTTSSPWTCSRAGPAPPPT